MPRPRKSISKSPKKMKSRKKSVKKTRVKKSDLLIVFDLDETVIQFLHAKNSPDAMELWHHETSENQKSKLKYSISEKQHIVILRPHLKEMFDFCKKNKNVRVGLWTLSERDYGKSIASILSREFDLPKHFFLFVYGEEDVEDYKTRKDLSKIWKEFPDYNQHNTFLVDDLKRNIMHSVNRKNGFLTPPFAPFGMKGEREGINLSESIENARNDKTMKEVVKLAKKIIAYNNKHPSDLRPLFDKKRMADMKMSSYLHLIAKEDPEVIRVASYGRPVISL